MLVLVAVKGIDTQTPTIAPAQCTDSRGCGRQQTHCGLAFLARVMRIGQLKKARGPVFKNESQRVSL